METVVEGQNQPKIAPKQINFQEIVEEGEEDRISALPDCLLLEILSRLPSTKHAIRTGALSKRWKYLWTLVHSLSFNDYIREQTGFFPSVDKTLNQCRQLKLKKFVVSTHYDFQFTSQVNNWIRYAISCNVEELNIKLWNMRNTAEFLLDQIVFISSCFTDLTLTGCIFNPTGAISWKNLRSLCICCVHLDEDMIKNILSGSPLLETLALGDCYGYRRLNITSTSVKNLVFSGYTNHDDDVDIYSIDVDDDDDDDEDIINIIEINAPNILSLTIEADLMLSKLLLLNVSSLVEANLDYELIDYYETIPKEAEEEMLKEFILNLRHVNELKIGDSCSEVLFRLEAKGFIFPSNMKYPDFIPPLYSDSNSRTREHDTDSHQYERCTCLTMILKMMRLMD